MSHYFMLSERCIHLTATLDLQSVNAVHLLHWEATGEVGEVTAKPTFQKQIEQLLMLF